MAFFYSYLNDNDNGFVRQSEGLETRDSFNIYKAGEVFEPVLTDCQLYNGIKDKENYSNMVGDFSFFFEDENFVYIINDELGTIKWFYSYDDSGIIVTPDFWRLAVERNVDVDDINNTAIYEIIMLGVPLSNNTWLDGIYTVPRGSIFRYSKITNKLEISQYLDINYTESFSGSESELFDRIDHALDKTCAAIESMNPGKDLYISTSGGLDSRFPLPYLSRFKSVSSFLLGKKSGFLEPFDLIKSRKMAKMFGYKVDMFSPEGLGVNEKIILDISRNPIGQSNILKAVDAREIIDFQKDSILLTGSHGGLIGGRVLNEDMLGAVSNEHLSKKIFYYYSIIKKLDYIKGIGSVPRGNKYIRKFKTALRLLGISSSLKVEGERVDAVESVDSFLKSDYLFSKEGKQSVYNALHTYIVKERVSGKNNLSVIMNYHLYRHSIRGVFESLLGQVKSYSVYMPYIYCFSKTWPREYLSGRVVMESFLYSRFPLLSKIPLQSFKPTISDRIEGRKYFVKKLLHVFSLGIRRLAIDYDVWWNNKPIRSSVDLVLKEKTHFYSIFNEGDVKNILSTDKYTQLGENLYKYKLMIDAVEKRDYMKFVFSDDYKVTEKY